ncbi:hypothetical protein OSTOST_00024, partial [Ostertagia ostertagi]
MAIPSPRYYADKGIGGRMAATAGAHSFRRLTLHNLYSQSNTRRKSSTAVTQTVASPSTLPEQPFFPLPLYYYRKPPSRPPSRPPSGPPSTPSRLSRHNTARSDVGVGRIFQVVQKPTLRLPFSDLAFVSTLPEHYLPDLVRGKSKVEKHFHIFINSYNRTERVPLAMKVVSFVQNIGRVKWDEFRRNGDDALEEDVSTFIPTWKKALKLLKILLPHVGLNILLLSYIAMGAIMFIWLEADHELQNRKEKLRRIYSMYDKIINESSSMCSGTMFNSSQVDSRLRPLLRILSRTHEYDDKFTESGQLWIDTEAEMTTRWSFAAAVLYALTVITSTGGSSF